MAFSKWREPKAGKGFWAVIAAVPLALVAGLFLLALLLKHLP